MTNNFGKRIKDRRIRLGISRKELSSKINTTQSYIWEIENDKIKNPSAQLIVNIASILQVSAEFLVPPSESLPPRSESNDNIFFRKYRDLPESEKNKLHKMLELMDAD